jgi:hypothetical protein
MSAVTRGYVEDVWGTPRKKVQKAQAAASFRMRQGRFGF